MRKLKRNLDFFQILQMSNTFCLSRQLHTDSRAIVHTYTHTYTLTPTMHKGGHLWLCCQSDTHFLSKSHMWQTPLIYHTSLHSTHDTGSVYSKLFRYIIFLCGICARGLGHLTHSAPIFCTLISIHDSLPGDMGAIVSRLSILQAWLAHSTACSPHPAHTMHWVAQGTLGKDTACVASYQQEHSFPKIWELEMLTANKQSAYLVSSTLLSQKGKAKAEQAVVGVWWWGWLIELFGNSRGTQPHSLGRGTKSHLCTTAWGSRKPLGSEFSYRSHSATEKLVW